MTNRRKFPERAEIVRAVAEATGGHGLPRNGEQRSAGGIVLPKVQNVEATGDVIFRVADAFCGTVAIGQLVTLQKNQRTGEHLEAKLPHLGACLLKMREEWPEPTPLQAAKLAIVEAAAKFQEAVYDLAPKVAAAQAVADAAEPACVPTVDTPMPEAPEESEAREPAGLRLVE